MHDYSSFCWEHSKLQRSLVVLFRNTTLYVLPDYNCAANFTSWPHFLIERLHTTVSNKEVGRYMKWTYQKPALIYFYWCLAVLILWNLNHRTSAFWSPHQVWWFSKSPCLSISISKNRFMLELVCSFRIPNSLLETVVCRNITIRRGGGRAFLMEMKNSSLLYT